MGKEKTQAGGRIEGSTKKVANESPNLEKGCQHSRGPKNKHEPHCLAPGLEPGKTNLTLEGDKEKGGQPPRL